jgi:hypothetical protein
MLTIDNQLYAHALSIFFKRVNNVEKVMGMTLICEKVGNLQLILSKYSNTKSNYNLQLNKAHLH